MPDPSNPLVARLWRANEIESVHRGCWVIVDTSGTVVHGAGSPTQGVFARSSTKSLQALPLLETGAAAALGLSAEETAVAISSHNGEPQHVEAATRLLGRVGLDEHDLRCGPQRPAGAADDAPARRITNNCSGKHAGFLATASHIGQDPATYLDPAGELQGRIRQTMLDMTDAPADQLSTAIDGCSAPTFRLPLAALATGLARMANPAQLDQPRAQACRRLVEAARRHPALVGGTVTPRFDTALLAATEGRLFSKVGAEGVQTVGIVGSGLGFAAKIDDGSTRSLHRLTIGVLAALGHLSPREIDALDHWHDPVRRNRDGLEVGRHEIVPAVLP